MRIRKVIKASKDATKRSITASKSTDEMLQAFEAKLDEFGIQSKTCVNSDTDLDDPDSPDDRLVEIYEKDAFDEYRDDGGGFGEPGQVYTMKDIKEIWNSENMNDPSLRCYDYFEDWWYDTRSNYLSEV